MGLLSTGLWIASILLMRRALGLQGAAAWEFVIAGILLYGAVLIAIFAFAPVRGSNDE